MAEDAVCETAGAAHAVMDWCGWGVAECWAVDHHSAVTRTHSLLRPASQCALHGPAMPCVLVPESGAVATHAAAALALLPYATFPLGSRPALQSLRLGQRATTVARLSATHQRGWLAVHGKDGLVYDQASVWLPDHAHLLPLHLTFHPCTHAVRPCVRHVKALPVVASPLQRQAWHPAHLLLESLPRLALLLAVARRAGARPTLLLPDVCVWQPPPHSPVTGS